MHAEDSDSSSEPDDPRFLKYNAQYKKKQTHWDREAAEQRRQQLNAANQYPGYQTQVHNYDPAEWEYYEGQPDNFYAARGETGAAFEYTQGWESADCMPLGDYGEEQPDTGYFAETLRNLETQLGNLGMKKEKDGVQEAWGEDSAKKKQKPWDQKMAKDPIPKGVMGRKRKSTLVGDKIKEFLDD